MNIQNLYKGIAGLILAMLFSCSSENLDKIKTIQNREVLPDIEVHNLNTTYSNKGIFKGRMKSPLVQIYNDEKEPYYEFPKGIYVEMYNDDSELESVIEANYAKYFQNERMWEAKYNVKAVNTKGDTLQTEHVYIYEKEKRIYSDEQVQITSEDGMRVVGQDGFESNMDFTIYKFENVTGIFNVKMDEATKRDSTLEHQQFEPKMEIKEPARPQMPTDDPTRQPKTEKPSK